MADQFPSIEIIDSKTKETAMRLEGGGATVAVGAKGKEQARVQIKSPLDGTSDRFVADADGKVSAGGHRASGALALIHESTLQNGSQQVTVLLDAQDGTVTLSRVQAPANVVPTIRAEAENATLFIGGLGVPGQIALRNRDEKVTAGMATSFDWLLIKIRPNSINDFLGRCKGGAGLTDPSNKTFKEWSPGELEVKPAAQRPQLVPKGNYVELTIDLSGVEQIPVGYLASLECGWA